MISTLALIITSRSHSSMTVPPIGIYLSMFIIDKEERIDATIGLWDRIGAGPLKQ